MVKTRVVGKDLSVDCRFGVTKMFKYEKGVTSWTSRSVRSIDGLSGDVRDKEGGHRLYVVWDGSNSRSLGRRDGGPSVGGEYRRCPFGVFYLRQRVYV